jgi:hypothetical protein
MISFTVVKMPCKDVFWFFFFGKTQLTHKHARLQEKAGVSRVGGAKGIHCARLPGGDVTNWMDRDLTFYTMYLFYSSGVT